MTPARTRSAAPIAVALLAAACSTGIAPATPAPAPRAADAAPLASWPPPRPIAAPLEYPLAFRQAIEAGTRTATGAPGPRYWRQWADYDVAVRVDPRASRVEGTVKIVYRNESPDALPVLWLESTQNFHAPGSPRLTSAEVTQGFELHRVTGQGQVLAERGLDDGPGYTVDGTRMAVRLPRPLAAGGTADLEIAYSFTIPEQGVDGRMGHSQDDLVFLGYWFPRMAVYDDVVGWQTDAFLSSEFYRDFGDYRYTIDAPAGWLVVGTGTLLNPEETLAPDVRERLAAAEASDTVVAVVGPGQASSATLPGRNGRLVWRFEADSVLDVAASLTSQSRWDVARTPVGDRDGDGHTDYARVGAVWRPNAPRWRNGARYAAHSIAFLSRYTGVPYPWPHMTAVEGAGIIGGGMEFPQMTLIGDYTQAGDTALYNVVVHELAHEWEPMIASSDERRYSWLDEGSTSFNENQGRKDFFPGVTSEEDDAADYVRVAGSDDEGPMMRRSDYQYPGAAFVIASYRKPATVLVVLRDLLGKDTFDRAWRTYFRRWAWKHPYPYDLWNTFEDVSGRDLGWFWTSWYETTWVYDQAVGDVTAAPNGSASITIEDRGQVPMPAVVRITREDGTTLTREVPVDAWLRGATEATVSVPAGAPITRVEIVSPGRIADVDRENDVWQR